MAPKGGGGHSGEHVLGAASAGTILAEDTARPYKLSIFVIIIIMVLGSMLLSVAIACCCVCCHKSAGKGKKEVERNLTT